MNTRRALPTGKPLVFSDTAFPFVGDSKEIDDEARFLNKNLIKVLTNQKDQVRMNSVMTMIKLVDGPVLISLILMIKEILVGLDTTMGHGTVHKDLHDIIMGELFDRGLLIEEDDTDNADDIIKNDSGAASPPYYLLKGTVVDRFSNIEPTETESIEPIESEPTESEPTESESIEPTESESIEPTESDIDPTEPTESDIDPTESDGSGSSQSWEGASMFPRLPRGVIRKLKNIEPIKPTEPISVGSPMVVGGYADWTDSSEREPPAPHPDDKWRYN
jgi:hypothetical protein